IDGTDPAKVFSALFSQFDATFDGVSPSEIAIDITGGKKPMDAAAFAFADFAGLSAWYVNFEDYEPVINRPRPTTSYYSKLAHPAGVFSLARRQRCLRHFDATRYPAARDEIEGMLELRGSEHGAYFSKDDWKNLERGRDICRAMAAWEEGDYRAS